MEVHKSKLNLEEFRVSEKTGFASGNTLDKLPEYFQRWNDLTSRLLGLMESKAVREHVDQLILLDHKKLSGHAELSLAHMQLSFFVAGYVWQNGPNDPAKKIPRCIAVPFYGVSESLSLPPVICYCDIILRNWRPIDPEAPLTFENLKTIYLFPGGHETDKFIRVSVGIELAFAPAIQRTLDAMYAAEASDTVSLTNSLEDVAAVLRKMTELLAGYHDCITTDTFFNVLAPYFKGYGPNTPLPQGLMFEGVRDEPVTAMSSSAAPTSTLPLVDAALGVEHAQGNRTMTQGFRKHMPLEHRQLIEAVEQRSQIRQYVISCKDDALTSAFESCLRGLTDFRSCHVKIVTKYVVIPGKGNIPGIEDLMAFLKGMRDESTGN
ncbi:indoleamine 2,3-dioxygenase 2-like [Pecten maximus]|uniref:indoleamine 2,3-dioxygenase 2-like n=1 Tax=Pecten maximus TaxID=6579 RepID=UPI001458F4E2|nr:indoleamine 2,3-dioxygenase 2-like [Pecten maximus]